MKLLFSAISAGEAAVLKPFADVVDLKDPVKGPLGVPSLSTVVNTRAVVGDETTLSVALGEMGDSTVSVARMMAEAGADILKVSLSALDPLSAEAALMALRRVIPRRVMLVAAFYAEDVATGRLGHNEAISIAKNGGANGWLIDTKTKNGRGLFRILDVAVLSAMSGLARDAGLATALAGSLGMEDIPSLLEVHPDYVGFRAAVTIKGERNAEGVDPEKAASLKRAIAGAENVLY